MNGGILTPAHNAAVEAERGLPPGTLIQVYQRREDLIRAAGRALFTQLRYAPPTTDQLRRAVRSHFISRMAASLELHMPTWAEYATAGPRPSFEQVMQQADGNREPLMHGLPAWFTPEHNFWLASITGFDEYEVLESYQQDPNVQRIVEEIRVGGPAPAYGELFTPPPYSPPRPRTFAEERAFGDPWIRRPSISRRPHLGDRYNNSRLPDSIAVADPSNWVFPTERAPPANGVASSDGPPPYSNATRDPANDHARRRARIYATTMTGRPSNLLSPSDVSEVETVTESDSTDSDEGLTSQLGQFLQADTSLSTNRLGAGLFDYRRSSLSGFSNARSGPPYAPSPPAYPHNRHLRPRGVAPAQRLSLVPLPSSSQRPSENFNSVPQRVPGSYRATSQRHGRPQNTPRSEHRANSALQAVEAGVLNEVRDACLEAHNPTVEPETESESEFEGFPDEVEDEPEAPMQPDRIPRRKSSVGGPARRTRSKTQRRI
ncbi:hypothetical protein CKM354_000769300 [Cercospora kikuchii]|uniref:Uncharacterized protein n=1 Tax=Cercospora kikuchii TaxID=84275 RepID=A0A9P3CLI3_9PEZI|nr:uncharacterized protein CKM354_000769300 [Cercospora kikuchii]GIZ44496.1 hypothetical protein CKM354_000769300 [Cercospora kikuchii]